MTLRTIMGSVTSQDSNFLSELFTTIIYDYLQKFSILSRFLIGFENIMILIFKNLSLKISYIFL